MIKSSSYCKKGLAFFFIILGRHFCIFLSLQPRTLISGWSFIHLSVHPGDRGQASSNVTLFKICLKAQGQFFKGLGAQCAVPWR